ncbi:penicillin acylase family protein [Natrinema sp. 1APR25-10V2]|uniref:penicillin acylase family protein n=1 Tax=Natrinema sp. 1APR25-10V2 TaxID=2951081 RepID=UPI002874DA1A|nr:penicillin acylase family protein [Natrinema sp. 1APR25-10V2]MDS0477841.1 penicillin acylase family protein [Natrinema sp. 1APR25-10V2]
MVGATATPLRGYLDRFAPFSGTVWDTVADDLPEQVESPYGSATLSYDDDGVPHVEADSEEALYFAAGYAQGADRLFQMDLQRRQMRGQLSAIVGDRALPSDRFHVKMDFAGAAAASWNLVRDSESGQLTAAFAAGINRHLDRPLPQEFDLLEYEPEPWQPVDTLLASIQIAWGLTGSFRTLRKETVAAEMGTDTAETLFPDRLDHDATILDHNDDSSENGGPDASIGQRRFDPELTRWVSTFESPPDVGSNSWVVSGDHTRSGSPIVANDPHLTLMAPPVWYEMHLEGPETHTRGVTFPGIPFVVIGENESGAWGLTNAGADTIDFYEYETQDGRYRYGEEFQEFDEEQRTIEVADGRDREVTVRKTVHGPVLGTESDGDELRSQVAVSWVGLTATRTSEAVLELGRSGGIADVQDALRRFDIPTQNFVYADRDGNTLYRVTGKVPVRQTDGEPVPGNRVFDGSDQEGEWPGFVPYGESTWDGFVPYEEMPHIVDPDYIGTANQRIVDDADYPYYFAEAYSTPFRGIRLRNRLDDRVESDRPVTREFMRDLQRDTHDERAAMFVPTMIKEGADAVDGATADLLADLEEWEYRMDRSSRAALVFARFLPHYRDVVFQSRLAEELDSRRDPEEYYGNDWVLITLPPDSPWFPGGRSAAIAEALDRTARELEENGWETFGDYNTTAIDHPFDREWLNYPRYATDGSAASLDNFRKESEAGSSWRQICPMDKSRGPSQGAFPGGNDGSPFSDHYADQLRQWADGEYKPIPLAAPDTTAVQFTEGDE